MPSNITPLYFFLAQTLYHLVKSNPLKCKFLKFLSAQVKICQIPHVIFDSTSDFPSNLASIFTAVKHNSSVIDIIDFGRKRSIKVRSFRIFEGLCQNLSNSSCQFLTDKLIPVQFLYHSSLSWHITPLKMLSSYIFNFGQKQAIKVPILRLSSAPVKLCQIPHVIFGSTSQFSFKSCIKM